MNAIEVARFFIYLAHKENKNDLTPLKLQKLLYYAQGYSFLWDKKELFIEDIEAWQYGPVIPDIYNKFKKYGHSTIPKEEGRELNSPKDSIETINVVWRDYKNYPAFELVKNTHKEEPWKKASVTYSIMKKESIKEYFEKAY
jgi:uncharacterized phage-associated protein